MKLRGAEQQLFRHRLRWRVAPGDQVFSRPLPAGEHSSADDFPVTGQRPAAGTQTKPNAVIVVVTPCSGPARPVRNSNAARVLRRSEHVDASPKERAAAKPGERAAAAGKDIRPRVKSGGGQ